MPRVWTEDSLPSPLVLQGFRGACTRTSILVSSRGRWQAQFTVLQEAQAKVVSQLLVRVRLDEVGERRRALAGHGRLARCAAKVFRRMPALVPGYGEQGQDKVGLVELDALAVNADEDLRYLLLIHPWRDFERALLHRGGEGIFGPPSPVRALGGRGRGPPGLDWLTSGPHFRGRTRYSRSLGGRPGRSGAGFAPLGPRVRPALGWVAS
jgi:hypothetical protein